MISNAATTHDISTIIINHIIHEIRCVFECVCLEVNFDLSYFDEKMLDVLHNEIRFENKRIVT